MDEMDEMDEPILGQNFLQIPKSRLIPSSKLTVRPCQSSGLKDE